MRKILRTLGIALSLVTLSTALFAQASVLSENCDLSIVGVTEAKTFLTFDRELRNALTKQDAGMLALLVKFPFRVNDDRGTYYLHDARSLQLRLHEIFTPAVRDIILKQRPERFGCTPEGIMYGDGVVWVGPPPERYAIAGINLPAASRPTKADAATVKFVCEADKHRVIVDTDSNDAPYYRSWNKPRSLTEKPDLEIANGKEDYEGSGVCRYNLWRFGSGGATFTVHELGCYENTKQPPADATGVLEVSMPGKPDVSWWCR